MDWQQIIVWLIGLAVVLYLLRSLYCLLRGGSTRCANCPSDCPLKNRKKR